MDSYGFVKFELPGEGGPIVVNVDQVKWVAHENTYHGEATVMICFTHEHKLTVMGTINEVLNRLINARSGPVGGM